MKPIFILIAVLSGAILVYSGIRLTRQLTSAHVPTVIPEIKGFEDVNANDDYNRLLTDFRQKIGDHQHAAHGYRSWYYWLSFLVTTLTAGSTLVSSIQAATTEASDKTRIRRFAIIIAFMTFGSTLANFTSSHFNDLRAEEEKKSTDLTSLRQQFFNDFDKSSAADRTAIISQYARRLDQ